MALVKPNIIAEALGITTNALRKRRFRNSTKDNMDYIVTDKGRVMYNTDTLAPNVRDNVEKITTKRTKQSHDHLMKSNFRYANSLGKVNERRKRIHDQEVKRKAEQLLERERQANERLSKVREPSLKKYVSWVNPNTMGNYWNSIQDYENSKNKKPFKGYY